ncbi:unnamed protein product [Mytilus edulis]|uniref:Uncharacterized protein n=1 Tax=Mytilus edulis TaxID=6550 RepID=A0A8S3Q2G0_MYTED|nr:unnamed protein product [Mytilus edulis]
MKTNTAEKRMIHMVKGDKITARVQGPDRMSVHQIGDVDYQVQSLNTLTEALVDKEATKKAVCRKSGHLPAKGEIIGHVIGELNKTNVNKAMHGKVFEAFWKTIETMLPEKKSSTLLEEVQSQVSYNIKLLNLVIKKNPEQNKIDGANIADLLEGIVEIINQDLVVQFTKDSGTEDYKVWPEIADISVVFLKPNCDTTVATRNCYNGSQFLHEI